MRKFLNNLKEYCALIAVILFFSGCMKSAPDFCNFFDYTTLLGKFGTIGDTGANFLGKADTSVRYAFMFALSIIPGIMLSLGIMGVATKLGAINAASKILTPVLKPLMGLPGSATMALTGSLQSSDSGAALSRDLYENKLITDRQRTIFASFQFSSGASIGVYLTAIPLILHGLTVTLLTPLAVIIVCKIIGANLIRFIEYIRFGEDRQTYNSDKTSLNSISDCSNKSLGQTFVDGAVRGWHLAVEHMLPNVIMAYVLITILQKSGLMSVLGSLLSPIMNIFGLPGEAFAVLIAAWLSGLGGVAVAATLFTAGTLNPTELTILTPAIFLMGAQIQYTGRILAVMAVPYRLYKYMFSISIFNAIIAMIIMSVLLKY
ncbi:nucleoside recognition domain-containing protein [Succinivibrio sp.]|uniref:nucleoside recognition domain-containing protein n=1 Tax=Succinivibrio sp. TaxID=2053619 RepID=UPI00386E80DE